MEKTEKKLYKFTLIVEAEDYDSTKLWYSFKKLLKGKKFNSELIEIGIKKVPEKEKIFYGIF